MPDLYILIEIVSERMLNDCGHIAAQVDNVYTAMLKVNI